MNRRYFLMGTAAAAGRLRASALPSGARVRLSFPSGSAQLLSLEGSEASLAADLADR